MNMLFTWDYHNVCVVFRQWQITTPLSLIISLLGVVAIVAGYEALREAIRQFEARTNKRIETVPRDLPTTHGDGEDDQEEHIAETTPFFRRPGHNRDDAAKRAHVIKSVLYGVQNFYAFMIMLIFMTYNGWIMVAVSVGAGLGYLLFGGRTAATKDTACH